MQLAYPQSDTRTETLRYLGAGGWQPDAASQVLLQKAEDALRAAATPRGVWKQLPLTALPLQNAGNDIARHLRGCDAMVLMAVTLGSGADTLMRRLELTDIALAAVVDAMASAVMEELCNALEAEIRTSVQAQGHYLTGRFSPGYGDCPLTLQQPFAIALDTVRGLGMAVTPENLLTPRKSVTAILGVADHPVTGARAGCGHCLLRALWWAATPTALAAPNSPCMRKNTMLPRTRAKTACTAACTALIRPCLTWALRGTIPWF